jgi:hypothetical protein
MWNPQSLLFSYDWNESFLYHNFKRWVPPPPNPPPITGEEKEEATTRRVRNPPLCKCGYCSELATPPPHPKGLDYIPFWLVLFHYRQYKLFNDTLGSSREIEVYPYFNKSTEPVVGRGRVWWVTQCITGLVCESSKLCNLCNISQY